MSTPLETALDRLRDALEVNDPAMLASVDQAAEELRQVFDRLGVDLRDEAQARAACVAMAVLYKILPPQMESKFLSLALPMTRFTGGNP